MAAYLHKHCLDFVIGLEKILTKVFGQGDLLDSITSYSLESFLETIVVDAGAVRMNPLKMGTKYVWKLVAEIPL